LKGLIKRAVTAARGGYQETRGVTKIAAGVSVGNRRACSGTTGGAFWGEGEEKEPDNTWADDFQEGGKKAQRQIAEQPERWENEGNNCKPETCR